MRTSISTVSRKSDQFRKSVKLTTENLFKDLTILRQGVQTRTFSYDSLSRLTQAVNPESGTINYAYDANGNLATKVDARGVKTDYVYDALNRVTNRNYSLTGSTPPNYQASPNVSYFYDNLTNAKGKLIKVENAYSKTEYQAFDILGRVTQSQQTTDGTAYDPMTYTYNLSGALIEQTYPSGRVVQNTLDVNGDLAKVESKKDANDILRPYAGTFVYSAAGAVASMRLGNGKFENTVFNSRLQPIQIGLGSSASTQDLLKLNYGYGTTDNNGNVQEQVITVQTVGSVPGFVATQTYSYDSLNRLKDATENIAGQTPPNWKQTFTYDRYGNRNFDEANTTQPASFANPDVTNPTISATNNRFASGQGYSYDLSGNTTADALDRTYIYDAENKQVEVLEDSVSIGKYFYDGDGKRIKKISDDEVVIFVYDAGGKLVAEYANQISQTPTISYLTNDHLGSPRITTDALGQAISRRDFMPFGEEIYRPNYGTDTVRQKFTGYERDNETNLDFAQARMYINNLGRFSTTDPIFESMDTSLPQSFNRYIYVLNNPLFFVDPNGELWIIVDGQRNPQWVDKCPDGTLCFTALALENVDGNLNVYGSKGAKDISEFEANKDGQIDVRELSQHDDARFIVAGGQNVPEEFLSVNAAGSLFNISELYHQEYSTDDKLVFTAGNASDGKPGNCGGKPCHSGHRGGDIDLRYMDPNGNALRGDNAYKNADVGRTKWLINAGNEFGFNYSYSGDETRFGRFDRTPTYRDRTEKVHRHHLHIGRTAPKKKK